MAVILDLVNTGTIPQTFASGAWPIATFNTGAWGFTWSPAAASTDAVWRPTGSAFGYWCIFSTQGEPNGSGVWVEYVVATQTHSIVLVRTSDGNVIVGARVPITWGANPSIRVVANMTSGAIGASSLTVSGAASGNATMPFTRESILVAGTLVYGQYGGSFTLPASTISDVDDTASAAYERSATMSATGSATTVATLSLVRSAALAATATAVAAATRSLARSSTMVVAPDASTAATINAAGVFDRSASMAVTPTAVTDATRSLARSAVMATTASATTAATRTLSLAADMTVTPTAATAATITGAVAFGPGVQTSGLWPFGRSAAACTIPGGYYPTGSPPDVDGRTPVTSLDTQVSGSTFYGIVMRRVSTPSKAIADNKGNTFTSLGRNDYNVTSPWEIETFVKISGAGGVGHTFTANNIVDDECTFAVDEIKNCAYLASNATSFTTNGATQISPPVSLNGPGWVYVDWGGDGAVSGAEGFDWTVTAVNEGAAVGSQWQVVDSRIRNHTNGWIQWKRWRRYFAAATSGIQMQLATVSPAQGARWHAAAFQEANIIDRVATMSVTSSATTSATRALARSSSLAVAPAASTAATRILPRSTSLDMVASAAVSAVAVRVRSLSLPIEAEPATAANRLMPRSADMPINGIASTSATTSHERSAAMSVASGASTAATVAAGASLSVSMQVAASAATAALRILVRSSAMDAAAGASAAAVRSFARSATMPVVASASVSAQLPGAAAIPLPAVLRITSAGSAPVRISAPSSAPIRVVLA